MKLKSLVFALLFLLPVFLLAWGEGHNDQARIVLDALSGDIKKFWNVSQKESIIKKYSHYPDSVKKISEAEREIIGKELCAFIDDLTPIRYRFHKDYGKAVAFLCLVKSFRENRTDSATIFAGTLLHSVADASALNHGAIINYVTYLDFENVAKPDKKFLDFSIVREYQNIEKNIYRELKREDITYSENIESAVIEVMMSGVKGGKLLASVESDFLFFYDGKATPRYMRGASMLFFKQVIEGVALIENAWRLAKSQEAIDLHLWKERLKNISQKKSACEFSKKYFSIRTKFVANRNAKDDSIFSEFFASTSNVAKSQCVGMVVEPLIEMDESRLGFSSRTYSTMIARTLKKNGYVVEMFCLNNPSFLPNPQEIPVFVVCAEQLTKRLSAKLSDYRARGGNIVIVGGRDSYDVSGLLKFFEVKDSDKIPVSKKYGKQNEREIKDMALIDFTEKEFKFLENPNTKSGWTKPFCDVGIRVDSSKIKPLLFLKNKSEKFCVGAIFYAGNAGHSAFLPMYAIAPFLFVKQGENFDWASVSLDGFGESILIKTLKSFSE